MFSITEVHMDAFDSFSDLQQSGPSSWADYASHTGRNKPQKQDSLYTWDRRKNKACESH